MELFRSTERTYMDTNGRKHRSQPTLCTYVPQASASEGVPAGTTYQDKMPPNSTTSTFDDQTVLLDGQQITNYIHIHHLLAYLGIYVDNAYLSPKEPTGMR